MGAYMTAVIPLAAGLLIIALLWSAFFGWLANRRMKEDGFVQDWRDE